MTYLHCPRCRLAIRCQAQYLTMTNCPRCLARAAVASPLFSSPLTAAQLRASERDVVMVAPSPGARAASLDRSGPSARPTRGRPPAAR
jgi:hypothetical protein